MKKDAQSLNLFVFLWDIEVARHLFRFENNSIPMYGDLPVGCGIAQIQRLIGNGKIKSYRNFLVKPQRRNQTSRHIFSGSPNCRANSLKIIFALETDLKSEEQFTQVHIIKALFTRDIFYTQ